MDLELLAWRNLARALPLVAALLLVFCPPVREWLAAESLQRALDRGARITEVLMENWTPTSSAPPAPTP